MFVTESTTALHTVARTLCCAAAVMLAAALALGLWSLFGATSTDLGEAPYAYRGVVGTVARWVVGVAAVVLVAVLTALRGRRWGLVLFVAFGGAVVLVANVLFYPDGLFATYRSVVANYAASQAFPAAMAAWVLTVAGCLVVALAGLPLVGMGPARRREWVVGAVVGIVVVSVVAGVLLRDADPARQYDGTTAAETAIPDVPATFAPTQRFTLDFDPGVDRDSWDVDQSVQPAGVGVAA